MDEQKQPSTDDSKQLKKLMESHLAVLEHKLGRAPTMEELLTFLKGAENSELSENQTNSEEKPQDIPEESEPKVLSYKVYTGMKSEGADRAPDPKKVLFYETNDGRVYDTINHEWCPSRPSILDHLQSRPMMFDEQGHDIMSALVHGVLDDEDYDALSKAKMLNEHHQKVWDLNKKLQTQMSELEKSQENSELPPEQSVDTTNENSNEQSAAADTNETENSDFLNSYDEDELPGQNVLEEIIRAAMEEAMELTEERVRAIVAEEVNRHMSELMAYLQEDEQATLEPSFQQYPNSTEPQE